jgi:hypothetical protein
MLFWVELFPSKILYLRLGYNFRRAEELRILEQREFLECSLGLIKFNKLKFEVYSRYTLAGNTVFCF